MLEGYRLDRFSTYRPLPEWNTAACVDQTPHASERDKTLLQAKNKITTVGMTERKRPADGAAPFRSGRNPFPDTWIGDARTQLLPLPRLVETMSSMNKKSKPYGCDRAQWSRETEEHEHTACSSARLTNFVSLACCGVLCFMTSVRWTCVATHGAHPGFCVGVHAFFHTLRFPDLQKCLINSEKNKRRRVVGSL